MDRRALRLTLTVAAVALALAGAGSSSAQAPVGLDRVPPPVDPQSWALPEWLTWDDYHPIPGVNWNDPARQAPRPIRAALILADFADRPFVVTLPEGGDVFSRDGLTNPIGVGGIPREEVPDFYNRFLITEPSELNRFHTINEYWLENSYGLIGVDSTAFGPYELEGNEHEYGLTSSDAGGDGTRWENNGAGNRCPSGDTCNRNADTEMIQASFQDVTAAVALNGEDYDFRWLLHAAYDESGVWQEFGEMLFADREDVPESLGNPDEQYPEWVDSRYNQRWTAFAAGEGIWSHAAPGVYSTQGESDGQSVFGHELSHIFGVLDNYNDPFGDPVRRSYSGPWDMLSRGTFNGPGGPHTRWQIPPTHGASMGSHHMLRNKLRLGFSHPGRDVMVVQRSALAQTGPLIADLWPRAYPLAPVTSSVGLHGIQIVMDRDHSPACTTAEDFRCDGGGYNNYTVEFVDQIGFDSFAHDSGVIIAKTKNHDLAPFIWVADTHPADINDAEGVGRFAGRAVYDYLHPGTGEEVDLSLGDYRQLSDALFHAGTGEGVVSEYIDEPNRLHFYVLEQNQPAPQPVPTYRVAVRSLDGGGPFPRSVVAAGVTPGTANPGRVATVTFTVHNTGPAPDLYRLSASVGGSPAWPTLLQHLVVEAAPGEVVQVPVYVVLPVSANGTRDVTLTATSEMDPSATSTATATVTAAGPPAADPAPPPVQGGGPPEPPPPVEPPPAPEQPEQPEQPDASFDRVAGDGRVTTAVALSQTAYPDGTDTVALARADAHPDALAGTALAHDRAAPLLLVDTDAVPEATRDEISRLGAARAVLFGGPAAISEDVAEQLEAMGLEVERVGGENRFATAAAVADALQPEGTTAYLAGADAFADALAAGPLAAYLGRPVLLTERDALPEETAAALAALEVTETVVVGGTAVVSDAVVAELEEAGHGPRRVAGDDRYATAVEIGEEAIEAGMSAERLWLATGLNWPDSLAAGPVVARFGDTFLTVHGEDLAASPPTEQVLRERAEILREIHLVGGTAAISEEAAEQIRAAADPDP